jgi:hypothetical protein
MNPNIFINQNILKLECQYLFIDLFGNLGN